MVGQIHMALIEVDNLSFTYPQAPRPALDKVSLSVKAGEFVLLCGPAGSGKTTLLRLLKREISPHGKKTGRTLYGGQPLEEVPTKQAAQEIGMVFQNPDTQIVLDTVIHELAFAMENLGYETVVIRKRVAEASGFFGIEELLDKSVHHISGGQKQIINLASVLMLQPKVLLLDEPTAQLDPVSAQELLSMLKRLNQELAMTIIISEHRLEALFPLADRVVLLDQGCIRYHGPPRNVSCAVVNNHDRLFQKYLPSLAQLKLQLQPESKPGDIPLDVKEARSKLGPLFDRVANPKPSGQATFTSATAKPTLPPLFQLKEVFFRYRKDAPLVLKNLKLAISAGDYLAVLGGNGAGKSTLLKLLAGLHKPQRGQALYKGQRIDSIKPEKRFAQIGYLAQNPMLYFLFDHVGDELYQRAQKLQDQGVSVRSVEELVELFELGPLLDRHPYDLSGGEKQKLALAIVLLSAPRVLLMDEPTKGLDPVAKEQLAKLLHKLRGDGLTIVMASHDVEFVAVSAASCALLFDGAIACRTSPSAFFSQNYFYTTAINRAVRDWFPQAIVLKDVMSLWPKASSILP